MKVDKTRGDAYGAASAYYQARPTEEETTAEKAASDAQAEQAGKGTDPGEKKKFFGLEEEEAMGLFARLQAQTKVAENTFDASTSKPKDTASRLTRRLVVAMGQFEVRQVIAEAQTDLIKLRIMAAGSGEDAKKAKAYVKKLEKLVNRAYSKITDLDKEDGLKVEKARAQRKKQEKLAEEIKKKLRKEQIVRRSKENGYLLEEMQEQLLPGAASNPFSKLDSGTEAQIDAQAQAMAAMEVAAMSSAGGGELGGVEVEVATGGGASSPVADIAAAVAEGGGCDISV